MSARASAQNEQYLELMETPTWHRLTDITNGMDWREDLGSLRDELVAKSLLDDIPAARAFWDQAEQIRNQRQHCGTPVAAPGCKVATRYIYQVFRIAPKQLVFAQTLFGFALAAADPRIVGINFVGAEDSQIAMSDYAEHMRMVAFVRRLYPTSMSASMPASLRPDLCHRRGCAATSGSPSTRRMPSASATAST